jgi:hypothetical protein
MPEVGEFGKEYGKSGKLKRRTSILLWHFMLFHIQMDSLLFGSHWHHSNIQASAQPS